MAARPRWPWRRCLLKGCERWYRPSHWQSRYCGPDCRQRAQRWRRHQASCRWRVTQAGKVRRREQCRRYRQRIPLHLIELPAESCLEAVPSELVSNVKATVAQAQLSSAGASEGQRLGRIPEGFWVHPCQRPGCYEEFAVRPHASGRRFCCGQCRQALRRVLDREAACRRRRRAVNGPRRRPSRPPP